MIECQATLFSHRILVGLYRTEVEHGRTVIARIAAIAVPDNKFQFAKVSSIQCWRYPE